MRVAVLGAGIVGLTTAYQLVRRGHEVSIIDRRPGPAMECSHANGGYIAISGNEVGLSLAEWEKLPKPDQDRLRQGAYTRMYQSGAHYVVDSIADIMPCIDDIEARLARGERP